MIYGNITDIQENFRNFRINIRQNLIKQSKVICGFYGILCAAHTCRTEFHQNERRFKMAKPDGKRKHRKGPSLEVILLYAF